MIDEREVAGEVTASARPTSLTFAKLIAPMRSDLVVVALDVVLTISAFALMLLLRYDASVPDYGWPGFVEFVPFATLGVVVSNLAWGLYGQLWRHVSLYEAVQLVKSGLSVMVVLFVVELFPRHVPLSVVVTGTFLATFLMGLVRFQGRLLAYSRSTNQPGIGVVVIGAGDAGAALVSDMLQSPRAGFRPVAVLDDDNYRHGRSFMGVPVAGNIAELPAVVKATGATLAVFAMTNAPQETVRRAAAAAAEANVALKIVPGMSSTMNRSTSLRDVRDAEIQDLLVSPPEVGHEERELLLAAFDSNWVAPAGPDIDAFERELAELTGAPAVAALSSGTAALHLAMMAVGVGPGDDVLVSTLTFGASAFATTYLGARPCFVDCEPLTWHLDPDLLDEELTRRDRNGKRPAAVVSVDLYGSVADGDRIAAVCAAHEVPLVQDAAEAVGAFRNGVHAGRQGQVGVLSFNGNKMVTTGGGGAIMSSDPLIVSRARYLSTQARQTAPWYEHEDVGFNYRMGNLNAAVGRGQLRTLSDRIAGRRRVRTGYERLLGAHGGVSFQQILDGVEPNHWFTTAMFDESFGSSPADMLVALQAVGVEARYSFKPMHLQPVFADNPVVGGGVAERLFARSLSLPSSSWLTDDHLDRICAVIASTRA